LCENFDQRESKGVVDNSLIEREVLDQMVKVLRCDFVIVGDQLHTLEHHVSVHRDLLTVFILLLPNIEEGLQTDSLNMRSFKHSVNIVDDTIKSRVASRIQN
jgi:predicted PP-loop superfamily ATPase